jgi:hypothetical protein
MRNLLQRVGDFLGASVDALESRANIRGMTTAADHYRNIAHECGKQAEKAASPQDKERWLKAAEKWLDLAQKAEAARAGRVQSPDDKAASKAANNPSDWDQLMARRS